MVPLDTGDVFTSEENYSEGAKAIAGKELSLSSCCIASLYIDHFSTVLDLSSEKYSCSA